jgi:competence protein ComEA
MTTMQKSPPINSANAVNINTASGRELERIPHVGPKLADEIINFRERHGPFRRPEHLILIRGFSDARYREVRDFIKTE